MHPPFDTCTQMQTTKTNHGRIAGGERMGIKGYNMGKHSTKQLKSSIKGFGTR
jgi:hypothetical protein